MGDRQSGTTAAGCLLFLIYWARIAERRSGQPEVFLLDEVLAVRNALTMVLAELDPLEFHTRMGFTVEESKQMRNALDSLAGQIRVVKTA